jgi:hypothetical protein
MKTKPEKTLKAIFVRLHQVETAMSELQSLREQVAQAEIAAHRQSQANEACDTPANGPCGKNRQSF